jgi:hypothetical protein
MERDPDQRGLGLRIPHAHVSGTGFDGLSGGDGKVFRDLLKESGVWIAHWPGTI